ncbi:1-acyl-sn-glycerol-3-phosphate acyltransferase [bacterium]|nr:1-acyl-sn-glycerol-3-phosphate acyltransferase [bacterium]
MDSFDDIRPYRDDELPAVMARLAKNELLVSTVRMIVWPGCPPLLSRPVDYIIRTLLKRKLGRIRSVDEFQRKIVGDLLLNWVISHSIDKLSSSGLENLSHDRSYIFISNHRDIVLDSALLNYTLHHAGHKVPYIAFGDNLLINEVVSDLIRVNKAFIVRRDLPPREQLKALKHLSAYIGHIREEGNHFWIAQREGRAKDGIDATNPAIIKMFYLNERKNQTDFSEFVKSYNMVPVAVSYEKDPCDRIKGWELYRRKKTGVHKKKRNEDLIAMAAGISGHKGRVHITFGKPLDKDYANEKEVAQAVDEAIHRQYRLWPCNFIAHDVISGTDTYRNQYNNQDREAFLGKYHNLNPEVRKVVLQCFANPVNSRNRSCQTDSGSPG